MTGFLFEINLAPNPDVRHLPVHENKQALGSFSATLGSPIFGSLGGELVLLLLDEWKACLARCLEIRIKNLESAARASPTAPRLIYICRNFPSRFIDSRVPYLLHSAKFCPS